MTHCRVHASNVELHHSGHGTTHGIGAGKNLHHNAKTAWLRHPECCFDATSEGPPGTCTCFRVEHPSSQTAREVHVCASCLHRKQKSHTISIFRSSRSRAHAAFAHVFSCWQTIFIVASAMWIFHTLVTIFTALPLHKRRRR